MRTRASIALLLPLACLLGCTLPYTPSPLTGNWQIQSGTAITSPPTYPYLVGALQGTNSALTGTFTAQIYTVNSTVESYSGTFNPSTGSLVLNSTLPLPANQTTAALSVPANPTDLATGTLVDQCGVCANGISTQVVGVEVAPLNGTYTGTLSGTLNTYSPFTSTPITGTTSVTFTQSATPNASGQFPLTGTITFPSSSGMSPVTLPGLISGIPIWLNNEPCVPPFSEYAVCDIASLTGSTLNAYTNPTATQITITSLQNSSPSGTTETGIALTGTLTLQ
jgi:hypothetical protein